MDLLREFFASSTISALFVCVALGFALGRIRVAGVPIGGIPGTLFAAILVGQIGVEVDANIKTMAFALFIYSLGYVSGPQFFSSLGRSTLSQVFLAVFCSVMVFVTVWAAAWLFDLDKGTAAGLLAGGTSESASVGTASEALAHLQRPAEEIKALTSNIGVAYAITYLFGFTLVVFFVSLVGPRMMGVDLKAAAAEYEEQLGSVTDDLAPGQEQALRGIVARTFTVTRPEATQMSLEALEGRFDERATVQGIVRDGEAVEAAPDQRLALGDRILLFGRVDKLIEAGEFIGEETTDRSGLDLVSESRDVVLTNRALNGQTVQSLRSTVELSVRRGVYFEKITRSGNVIRPRPRTTLQMGDVITVQAPAHAMDGATEVLGYAVDQGIAVDYVYLGLGVIAGILVGMLSVNIAGSAVALHTGGGCLISGLLFGWLRSRHHGFGGLPAATALHLRDFGLAVFIASVGLATGPQAWTLLKQEGVLLPILSLVVVLVPLITSMYFARYVLRMNPAVICGGLAGCLTCTAGLNAAVQSADSEVPVLGYTVPYAISNVILTLLGPVIVLTV